MGHVNRDCPRRVSSASAAVQQDGELEYAQPIQSIQELDDFRLEITRRDQEIMAMAAKMKTLEEQHQDYQRHIAVLKESLCAKEEHYNMLQSDVEELRNRLQEKNRMIDNLENLLKEKDNQVDMARARLSAMQAHHCSSEGALTSLEEAIGDKEKQMQQLRDQRDRVEAEKKEERELHERELAKFKMKLHSLDSEVEKLTTRLHRALAEKDRLEARFKGPYVIHKCLPNDRYVIRDIDGAQQTQIPYDGVLESDKLRKWMSQDADPASVCT
ncbi:ELKS/Rab6-interacting/CAST family member 1-like [Anopheles maculipalpis]|uniref:ELKS/Rab6-interacting/CAST family member 1-like n=1 Tax=Anopheles maculipalpis TaxID=1496333 RepID=UPI0021590545|nr:ELKS/Rab6-interacting/CAST family member 1-like [Anopheles maculipalpis]